MACVFKGLHFVGLSLALLAVGAAGRSSSILPEVAKALPDEDAKAIESQAEQLQEALRPVCASMPHNEGGKMSRSVVRYVLHRLFMQRGWSVRGLEPDGKGWHEGSPEEVLKDGMPAQVVELFGARIAGEGLDLADVALLAAAFKAMVRGEVRERLEAVYRAHNLEKATALAQEQSILVLDTYVAAYVTGANISALNEFQVSGLLNKARRQYHSLPQVLKLAGAVKQDLVGEAAASFSDLERVAEEFGERFGPAEDGRECRPRKKELLELEEGTSGRVKLSTFYRAALDDGKWHFGESKDYLRQLGALDETDSSNLQVIIPNYVASKSNCADTSRYYSACCLSECEALLGRLEIAIGSPSGLPSEIAPLVAAMDSDTVPGNRTLPAQLLRRLDEVAEGNGGRVPLHGRLFAQWLHHAYPRECPFPHLSGTTSPARVEEWAALEGQQAAASREEMRQHVEASESAEDGKVEEEEEMDDDGECAPWMADEEILAPHWHAPSSKARCGFLQPSAVRRPEEVTQRGSASVLWWVATAVLLIAALATGAVRLPEAPKESGRAGRGQADRNLGGLSMYSAV